MFHKIIFRKPKKPLVYFNCIVAKLCLFTTNITAPLKVRMYIHAMQDFMLNDGSI